MTSYLVLQASQAFLQAITMHNHVQKEEEAFLQAITMHNHMQKEEEETKGLRMDQGVRIPTFGNLSSFAMSSFVNYLK
jgi:hypothetical protein